jgi:hypothetical protein
MMPAGTLNVSLPRWGSACATSRVRPCGVVFASSGAVLLATRSWPPGAASNHRGRISMQRAPRARHRVNDQTSSDGRGPDRRSAPHRRVVLAHQRGENAPQRPRRPQTDRASIRRPTGHRPGCTRSRSARMADCPPRRLAPDLRGNPFRVPGGGRAWPFGLIAWSGPAGPPPAAWRARCDRWRPEGRALWSTGRAPAEIRRRLDRPAGDRGHGDTPSAPLRGAPGRGRHHPVTDHSGRATAACARGRAAAGQPCHPRRGASLARSSSRPRPRSRQPPQPLPPQALLERHQRPATPSDHRQGAAAEPPRPAPPPPPRVRSAEPPDPRPPSRGSIGAIHRRPMRILARRTPWCVVPFDLMSAPLPRRRRCGSDRPTGSSHGA